MKVQPFRVILIHPSGNLTHPPHDSPTDENYNMRVDLTATDLPVPATAPSMIAARKNPLSRYQYACRCHLRFRQQPASQFFTKFYLLKLFT